MTSDCDNLDAYFADDLPVNAAMLFAQHIEQCATCREAVAQQRWINALLSSDACATVEPIPPTLRDTLRAAIARRRQAARFIACGLAAAATLAIVAVGWTLQLNRRADGPRDPTTDHLTAHIDLVNSESANAAPSRATFVSNGDTIAVSLESADDNVTIVQLYPTTETERRTQNELTLELLYSESNGS